MRHLIRFAAATLFVAIVSTGPASAIVKPGKPDVAAVAASGLVEKVGRRHHGFGYGYGHSYGYGSRWGGYHPGYGYGGYPYRHYGYNDYGYSPRYYSYYDPYEYHAYKRYKRYKRRQRAHRIIRHFLNHF